MDKSLLEKKLKNSQVLSDQQKQILLGELYKMPEERLNKLDQLLTREEGIDWKKENELLSQAYAKLKQLKDVKFKEVSDKLLDVGL